MTDWITANLWILILAGFFAVFCLLDGFWKSSIEARVKRLEGAGQ